MGAGLSIAPLSLSMFAVALAAGRRGGKRRPASLIRAGFALFTVGMVIVEPIAEERVSEAAGVNSAGGSFGLSFGLAFAGAILLAVLSFSFTNMAQSSTVLSPAEQ